MEKLLLDLFIVYMVCIQREDCKWKEQVKGMELLDEVLQMPKEGKECAIFAPTLFPDKSNTIVRFVAA